MIWWSGLVDNWGAQPTPPARTAPRAEDSCGVELLGLGQSPLTSRAPGQALTGETMNQKTWVENMKNRAADLRTMVFTYGVVSLGLLYVVVSEVAADDDRLAVAAMIALVGILALVWNDSAMADLSAGVEDMDEEVSASAMGRNFAKAPFVMFRVLNLVVILGIAVTQLMALYN